MSNIIKQIVVHQNPHLDELVAIWLLRNHGEQKFPEISRAKLVVWGKNELIRTPPEMAAMNGILLLGLGGGMFDDHVPGRENECATTLVAKYLGKAECPLLKRLLLGTAQADANADGPLEWLANRVKGLNRYWAGSLDLEKLYGQIEADILVEIERRKEYLSAKETFRHCYKQRIGEIKLVAVDKLDNCQFQHVARSGGAQVIVQRNEAGRTQILTGEINLDRLNMAGLAVRIRKSEMAKSGIRPSHYLSDEELSSKGTLQDIPQWYLEGGFLLNGSESFTDVPPSGITMRDLLIVVEKYLYEIQQPKEQVEDKTKKG